MRPFDDRPTPTIHQLDWATQMETAMEGYKFTTEEDDDPHDINIPE